MSVKQTPSAFSDRESLIYQQKSPISRCRPWTFVNYRKEISATIINILHIAAPDFN